MIRILIVDDSKTELQILKNMFNSEKDMEVVGCANNGKEAIELAALLKPDIITMDIAMPVMDGLEATRYIMAHQPIPIVVISSRLQDVALNMTYQALESGALSVIEKPLNITSPTFYQLNRRIIDMVRSMAELKVIKKRFFKKHNELKKINIPLDKFISTHYEVIAIGTSVGGPQVLRTILSKLPKEFPTPIVIVQHMTPGFITGFAKWLNNSTSLTVKMAEDSEVLKKGIIYIAPDNFHLTIVKRDNELLFQLDKSKEISGFCPSATVLLQSVANACGKNAIGILLTGMGNDGAAGLLELKHAHGHTIIQDENSAVVFGMAGVAKSIGAVDKIIPPELLPDYLIKIVKGS